MTTPFLFKDSISALLQGTWSHLFGAGATAKEELIASFEAEDTVTVSETNFPKMFYFHN